MSPDFIANLLFALEKFFAALVDRQIKKFANEQSAKEFAELVNQYRSAKTDQEKDDAAVGMEEKFKERSRR